MARLQDGPDLILQHHFRGLLMVHWRYGPQDCSPMAALVTMLRWSQVTNCTARQRTDLPTFIWAELSAVGILGLRGALHDFGRNVAPINAFRQRRNRRE
jgi:hypothetical protein